MQSSSQAAVSADSGAGADDKDARTDEASDDDDDDDDDEKHDDRDATLPVDAEADAPGRPDTGTPRPGSGGALPASVLDLKLWKLTVPVETSHRGTPDEYTNPELQTLLLPPYFVVSPEGDAVVFQANAGGATTGGSSYPRSELREMKGDGSEEADWSMVEGRHTMRVREAITHLPEVKPHVVAAQIHDAEDDVVMVRLEQSNLFVESGGESVGVLDANYQLGTVFTVEIVATNGQISVSYNGEPKVTVPSKATGCYFKAGCYTQSNTSRGDEADAYGQVVIHELTVSHDAK